MTNEETTRKADRAALVAILVILLLPLLGLGIWWFAFRQPLPPEATPTITPTATQIIVELPDAPTSTPTSTPTRFIPDTPTPLPTSTPTSLPTVEIPPTHTPTNTLAPTATPDLCAGVVGDIYTIQPGDTLWFIAGCLGDPFDYTRLAELNGLSNPHLIHAGNELRLR